MILVDDIDTRQIMFLSFLNTIHVNGCFSCVDVNAVKKACVLLSYLNLLVILSTELRGEGPIGVTNSDVSPKQSRFVSLGGVSI